MESKQLVAELKTKLGEANFTFTFDEKHDKLRLEHKKIGRGMDISLPEILTKYETKKQQAIDEVIYTIEQTFLAMQREEEKGFGGLASVYPIIRSTSFPKKSNDGHAFVMTDHTAETRIYYALDLGTTYRLIDESMLPKLNVTEEHIREAARFSVKKLPTSVKRDEVSGNIYYFLNQNDGYDASRILNESFLKEMESQIEGEMTVSVPHQDVLIIGDIRNEVGYDVLAQMTMHFFTVGAVPITSLSFVYENGHLEPIFILAKNKVKKEQEEK
ncbi:DUF1444 domain-containing protein [Solibacillus sp. FSL W7-1472]|uniref:DUF1444 domain-containing protein n=2 Tax=Solibacillus TaxID=648800 RepID=F2F8T0_SOLSS|nr:MULTISPECIES: DUF1444 domain-containing protein [Solibacillus]AMO86403.1 hypothetical protein SOLI23_12600 [Solibacillus silvestris]EKB43858.1 hypothetical protein B857_03367 [Solibacillus isronensis B3W22]OBW59636.1 hypothetical protein A9986_00235 [Solibacillus silvestris]BAK15557.1 uncharacterized protein SSIL_1134 [Solibacillus silvestris StLB046]